MSDRCSRHRSGEARIASGSPRGGVSPSEVVREAIEVYLRDRPKCETSFEIATRIGLIGCAKDLPPDLSTKA